MDTIVALYARGTQLEEAIKDKELLNTQADITAYSTEALSSQIVSIPDGGSGRSLTLMWYFICGGLGAAVAAGFSAVLLPEVLVSSL